MAVRPSATGRGRDLVTDTPTAPEPEVEWGTSADDIEDAHDDALEWEALQLRERTAPVRLAIGVSR